MEQIYDWAWVEARVSPTVELWNSCAVQVVSGRQRYSAHEQQRREKVYDEGLEAVEQEVRRAPRTRGDRIEAQNRIVRSFARFSAAALDLDGEAIDLLTNEFLPVGTKLAGWARRFDRTLSMPEIIQACRNAWTACGLQPLLGEAVGITPSILGYSLLYPYSDNYLDQEGVTAKAKLRFSERFRRRLRGETLAAADHRERALWTLIELIEGQYPRAHYPQVFDCMLAIHKAQEESIELLSNRPATPARGLGFAAGPVRKPREEKDVLRVTCGKGGSSVLADACLARGWLRVEESQFAFEWGVLLQLGDDLQDLREDMQRGSVTLFSRAAARGKPLDELAMQLLSFSEKVGARMDRLPKGSRILKELLKMSWQSLIIRAVADSHEFFSASFLAEAEQRSPFRFEFLRARQKRLASQQGLYSMLFEVLLEEREDNCDGLPLPHYPRDQAADFVQAPFFGLRS